MGLTCGAFEQHFGTGGQEFDCQISKSSNTRGLPGGRGGGMLMLQIDRCITVPLLIYLQYQGH